MAVTYNKNMTNDETKQSSPIDLLIIGDLISLQEAAKYAGLTKGTLHSYAKSGRLKAKKIGSFWVTTRAAVDAYLQSRHLENIPKKYRSHG